MFVSPDAAFDIYWVVMMMFATLIGGIGTLEGPVIGMLVWFALREVLSTWQGLSGGHRPCRSGFSAPGQGARRARGAGFPTAAR